MAVPTGRGFGGSDWVAVGGGVGVGVVGWEA